MPLYSNGLDLIKANLEAIERAERPSLVTIGTFTAAQLNAINQNLCSRGFQPTGEEIVFLGRHTYDRRIVDDGYSIEDVLDQIESALAPESITIQPSDVLAMQNPVGRHDRYGNSVRDRAVFRCTAKYLRAELYTVYPRGDHNKPTKKPLVATSGFQSPATVPVNSTASGAPVAAVDSMHLGPGLVNTLSDKSLSDK
jgi:hypothetical protein